MGRVDVQEDSDAVCVSMDCRGYFISAVEEKFPQRKFSGTERDARRNFVIGPNFGRNLSEILILGFRRGFQMPILGFRS